MRDNGAIEGGANGFAVGDSVVVLTADGNLSKVIAHTDGIRFCGEHGQVIVSLTASQLTYIGAVLTLVYRHRVFLWDAEKNCMGAVKGVAFPCDPTDAKWVAWRAERETISTSMFTQTVRGTEYHGRSNWPLGTQGTFPDETLPELDLTEPNYNFIVEEWGVDGLGYPVPVSSHSHTEMSSIKTSSSGYAVRNGLLLHCQVPSTPVEYSTFRTSVTNDFYITGRDLWNFPADGYLGEATFKVHTPFGELASYGEFFQVIAKLDWPAAAYWGHGPSQYTGVWPMKRNLQTPEGHRGFYERLYLDQTNADAMSDNVIVNLFIHQYRNLTLNIGTWDPTVGAKYYPLDLIGLMGYAPTGLGSREVNVHAQAKFFTDGVTGKDFLSEGRTSGFESAIKDTINALYLGLDTEDSNNIWNITSAIEIVQKKP